nr:RidA family protein [uncultured Allomuricauda sp.]
MKASYLLIGSILLAQLSFSQQVERKVYHIPGHENVENGIGYSHAIKVGKTLFIAGTVDGQHDDMEAQIKTIYKYVEDTLKHYGASTADIVKENIYTTDLDEFKKNMGLRKSFYKEGKFPTSTWVQVERLFIPKLKVEIELIAVVE